MATSYALIADIIGSRRLPDRAAAQEIFTATLLQAATGLDLSQAPHRITGEERQAAPCDLTLLHARDQVRSKQDLLRLHK